VFCMDVHAGALIPPMTPLIALLLVSFFEPLHAAPLLTMSQLCYVSRALDSAVECSESRACQHCFAGTPLTATLVWHDAPATTLGAETLLVNDLDLEMRVAALGGLKLCANAGSAPDRVNNVERVRTVHARVHQRCNILC
jgi:hypothetical protein